jgi:hypothetical protein
MWKYLLKTLRFIGLHIRVDNHPAVRSLACMIEWAFKCFIPINQFQIVEVIIVLLLDYLMEPCDWDRLLLLADAVEVIVGAGIVEIGFGGVGRAYFDPGYVCPLDIG